MAKKMHRIKSITVKNFRSIKSAEFELASYTPLVGYNNAGKTNILQALSWVIRKSSLDKTDFFDADAPVVVTAEICGIDDEVLGRLEEKHRDKIAPFVSDEVLKLRRTQASPSLPVAKINLEICNSEDEWGPHPAGIDAAIGRLFPEPIFIGAMENATDDVAKMGSGTTIGKLMKEIMPSVSERYGDGIVEALQEISTKLSANGSQKDPTLSAIDEKLSAEMARFFPGVVPKTHIPTPGFPDFVKGATIKLFEGDADAEGRDTNAFGHGAQRSVQIALVKCLADLKRDSAGEVGRTTLLLIDEPELYLHPQAIEVVRAALWRLSQDGYQIAFSTHSAGMIQRADAQDVLLIRRTPEEGTCALPRLRDAVRQAIDHADHQSEVLFDLSNSSKFLFSERVLLVEGKTENVVFPALYEKISGATLAEDRIALVQLNGVPNIVPAMRVLRAMGIETMALVDLDFAFRQAIRSGCLREDDEAVSACRHVFERLGAEGKISLNGGLPTKRSDQSAAEAMKLFSRESDAIAPIEQIHRKLKEEGIWTWRCGDIEAHLGLTDKSSRAHSEFLRRIEGAADLETIPDFQGLCVLVDWLRGR